MNDRPLGIGMIGLGTVGGGVAKLLREHAAAYAKRAGRPIELRKVLIRDVAKAAASGKVDPSLLTDDAAAFFTTPDVDLVVEVAGGAGVVGEYVRQALRSGKHVATANKSLLAADGPELFAIARGNGVSIAFEASCAGGIPCITALMFGLMANRITGLYGILNGTCNYILTEMTSSGKTYATALAEAQEAGFAEADPTLDVSGADAAQKLAILASLAFGARLDGGGVPTVGIDQLQLDDIRFGAELGYDIKLLGIAEQDAATGEVDARVEPCFVSDKALLAQVRGPFNALSTLGDAVGHTLHYGPGAGELPTASAVVSDILNVAAGWYPTAFTSMQLTPDLHAPPKLLAAEQRVGRFYLRFSATDKPGVMAEVTRILGEADISISAVLQHEPVSIDHVPVVVTTHDARRGDLITAAGRIGDLDHIAGRPTVLPIIDLPD